MDVSFFKQLHSAGHLSDASLKKIQEAGTNKLFSLYWELKTLLYLGVLLLSGGLGTLIYKNIDSIGHQAVLLIIALVCAACFFYCFKHKRPWSPAKVAAPNSFFDYTLLLGCLLLVTFIGYLQSQYNVFGSRYGLATFIPMLLLFCAAYYFDHLGILALAITALAAWAGLAVTPTRILQDNDFTSASIIGTGFLLGLLLLAAGYASVQKNFKAHFEYTYINYGTHLLFISTLAGLFNFDNIYLLIFLLLAAIGFLYYREAMKRKSFYYLLITALYFYIGLSYTVVRLLFFSGGIEKAGVYLAFLYFIASAAGLIIFLIRANKKLKT